MGRGIRLSTPTSENDNYSPATICVPRAISINREDASAEEVRWRQSRWVRGGFEHGGRRKEQSDLNWSEHRRHSQPEPHITAADLKGGRHKDGEGGYRVMSFPRSPYKFG